MALFRLTTSSSAWARSGSEAQSAEDASSVTRTLVIANRSDLSLNIDQNILLHCRAKLDKADKKVGNDYVSRERISIGHDRCRRLMRSPFRQSHKNDSHDGYATGVVCLIPPIFEISLFGVVERDPPELRRLPCLSHLFVEDDRPKAVFHSEYMTAAHYRLFENQLWPK